MTTLALQAGGSPEIPGDHVPSMPLTRTYTALPNLPTRTQRHGEKFLKGVWSHLATSRCTCLGAKSNVVEMKSHRCKNSAVQKLLIMLIIVEHDYSNVNTKWDYAHFVYSHWLAV